MEFRYNVRFLLNGVEGNMIVLASSAAAAHGAVQQELEADSASFELIQVVLVDEA